MEHASQHPSPQQQLHYHVGYVGKEKIKQMLSRGDPQQAIEVFSNENSLDMPAASTIYKLLDSLGNSRWSIHQAVLEATIANALRKIQSTDLTLDEHMALLVTMKPYLGNPRLQMLPLKLLAKRPHTIPNDICDIVMSRSDLYESCSLDIKRELWCRYPSLFRKHMLPMIEEYIGDSKMREMSQEISGDRARASAKGRRLLKPLANIILAINDSLQLYMQTLGMVRELFLQTQDTALSTLRLDMAMCMHENNVSDIVNNDVCHALAWSFDACIMKQAIDKDSVEEIQHFFDGIDPDDAPYGEFALILSSPYVRHILARYIFSILSDIAPNAEVSARYSDLKWPSTIFTMGLSAHRLLSEENATFPNADRRVTKTFFRGLLPFIRLAQIRDFQMAEQLKQQHGDTSSPRVKRPRTDSTSTDFSGGKNQAGIYADKIDLQPTQEDIAILSSSEIARQVVYVFILERIDNMDIGMSDVWLPVLTQVLAQLVYDIPATDAIADQQYPVPLAIPLHLRSAIFEFDAFVHSLVSHAKDTDGFIISFLNAATQCISANGSERLDAPKNNADASDTVISKAKDAIPLVDLLVQSGHLRHHAHIQTIMLMAECSRVVANSHSYRHHMASIQDNDAALCLIYHLSNYAAAHFAVDFEQEQSLTLVYRELAEASPKQAFRFTINASTCPNISKFLK